MQQRRMSGVMRMYEKLKTLKDKLQKMKTNRANRQIGQTFHFSPFSRKQKQVLTWWCKESPVHDMDGVIADGAIRSGKTISMSLSFVMWAMSTFTGQNFAMCGKTIRLYQDASRTDVSLSNTISIALIHPPPFWLLARTMRLFIPKL